VNVHPAEDEKANDNSSPTPHMTVVSFSSHAEAPRSGEEGKDQPVFPPIAAVDAGESESYFN
jgi:hypothetical protein